MNCSNKWNSLRRNLNGLKEVVGLCVECKGAYVYAVLYFSCQDGYNHLLVSLQLYSVE